MIQRANSDSATLGLMLSGGLDSAILLVQLVREGYCVQPFYVSAGCQWEAAERAAIDRLLLELDDAKIGALVEFAMPVNDLFARHWSLTGVGVPDETTSDEAVFLPARNPLLLLKPALWCGENNIGRLALATLADNPFSDATPEFCQLFAELVESSTGQAIEIVQPFADRTKQEILRQAIDFPFELTFSCLAPQNGKHCGCCNKCAERANALRMMPCGDATRYTRVTAATF